MRCFGDEAGGRPMKIPYGASDRALLPLLLGDRALKAGMLVFVGAKKVLYRPWDGATAQVPKNRASKAGRMPRG